MDNDAIVIFVITFCNGYFCISIAEASDMQEADV